MLYRAIGELEADALKMDVERVEAFACRGFARVPPGAGGGRVGRRHRALQQRLVFALAKEGDAGLHREGVVAGHVEAVVPDRAGLIAAAQKRFERERRRLGFTRRGRHERAELDLAGGGEKAIEVGGVPLKIQRVDGAAREVGGEGLGAREQRRKRLARGLKIDAKTA